MVVTLHACDTATDYALGRQFAECEGDLSVPCCQHEVNKQMESELFAPVFRMELSGRMAALYADACGRKC